MELDDEFDDEPRSTHHLIERQRKLGESPRPLDHLYAVAVGGALSDRLNEMSDRQIGQLLFDFCWAECYFNSPELIIVTQAIDRLRRSTGGVITNEEAQDSLPTTLGGSLQAWLLRRSLCLSQQFWCYCCRRKQ